MEIVNGYICKTCCDVDLAKRNIDPAHPKDGPFGQDKVEDPAKASSKDAPMDAHGPAVVLDGRLSASDPVSAPAAATTAPGARLDLAA